MTKLICTDVYTVKPGDTIYGISKRYGVSAALLMRVNRLRNPYCLMAGSELCIPGYPEDESSEDCTDGTDSKDCTGGTDGAGSKPQDFPDDRPDDHHRDHYAGKPVQIPNAPGCDNDCFLIHMVQKGDTLYMIAKKYGLKLDDIMDANPHADAYNLIPGMKLCIPGKQQAK